MSPRRAIGFCLAALVCGAAAPSPEASIIKSPEAGIIKSPKTEWQKGIADQNSDYASVPHAMLKIQDAAYLGDGQSAALVGTKGKPQSWHWVYKNLPADALTVSFKSGLLRVTQNGKAISALITKSIPVDADVDVAGQPTQVGAGVQGWRIFVYDQKNPAAVRFKSVAYFPYDPVFRATAAFTADAKLPGRVFKTPRGTDKQFFHAGDARFTLKGKPVTLPLYSDSNDPKQIKDMSAFFTDALTGKGAYGAGRYVDAEAFGKFPPVDVIIDFNFAYNPNCARSAFFTCPVAIDAIPLAMAAGEKDPHSLH
jgi:uncharacterized protein (DUF1684 family)